MPIHRSDSYVVSFDSSRELNLSDCISVCTSVHNLVLMNEQSNQKYPNSVCLHMAIYSFLLSVSMSKLSSIYPTSCPTFIRPFFYLSIFISILPSIDLSTFSHPVTCSFFLLTFHSFRSYFNSLHISLFFTLKGRCFLL